MTEQITLAIVGCGVMGGQHARHAAAMDAVAVAHVCDPNRDKAEALAERIGCAACTDHATVLASDVDAVVLTVPHRLHRSYAVAALEAGKHVLLEKPIACTEEDALAIAAASGKAQRHLLVAHILRFYPANLFAYQVIQEGALGALFNLRYHAEHHADLSARAWMAAPDEGGVLVGGGIHHTDLLAWWGGEIRAVRAYGRSVTPLFGAQGTHDHGVILYEFASGAVGQSIYSLATHDEGLDADQAVLSFEHGTLRIGLSGKAQLINTRATMGYEPGFHEFTLDNRWSAGLRHEMQHFIDCIRGASLRLTAQDAAYALRVACAAKRSAESEEMGARVALIEHACPV